jgi:AraC-like DNA-binding protein
MPLAFDQRLSESPFVERVWRTRPGYVGDFTSVALSHWQMCIWTQHGRTTVTVRGPETKASSAFVQPDTDYLGIVFKLGTLMPPLPASTLVDQDFHFPDASGRAFWLNGSAWAFPDYDNADTFVQRLVREGLLVREPVIAAVLRGQQYDQSLRSAQRRFLRAVGVTYSSIHQIERARHAALLLRQGKSILDVVDEAGYADQPHMTRALKRLVGLTPAQILRPTNPESLSFLFKTHALA